MESRFLAGAGLCLRIPTKTSEFDRVVLSKRNDMSLRNLLPKPYSEVVGDHFYTPILSQVQWFALTQSGNPVKAREHKMTEAPGFQEFLKRVLSLPASPGTPTVVVKVIFWMDGYDLNSSSKTNCKGCWAATTTFVFYDVAERQPYMVRTGLFSNGPGKGWNDKEDHTEVIDRLWHDSREITVEDGLPKAHLLPSFLAPPRVDDQNLLQPRLCLFNGQPREMW
jgi:hypothetical protein